MNPRIDIPANLDSPIGRALFTFSSQAEACLDRPLFELVKIRASQINGCAYCIDMHTKDARSAGETEQRIYALNGWRETPFFTGRERAALEWTEAVTRVADTHVPDEVYERVAAQFEYMTTATPSSDQERKAVLKSAFAEVGWFLIGRALRDEITLPPYGRAKPASGVAGMTCSPGRSAE